MRTDEQRAGFVDEFLSHFGVKGMRWGQTTKSSRVTVSQKGRAGKKLKSEGGHGRKPSSDAIAAKKLGQVKKKSGVHALSNQEIEAYSKRLQLEQNLKRLEFENKPAAKKFVSKLLGQQGSNAANQVASQATSKAVKRTLAKTALAA